MNRSDAKSQLQFGSRIAVDTGNEDTYYDVVSVADNGVFATEAALVTGTNLKHKKAPMVVFIEFQNIEGVIPCV